MNLLSGNECPLDLCHAVCAEAFNPDEDDEDKEPRVNCVSYHKELNLI